MVKMRMVHDVNQNENDENKKDDVVSNLQVRVSDLFIFLEHFAFLKVW